MPGDAQAWGQRRVERHQGGTHGLRAGQRERLVGRRVAQGVGVALKQQGAGVALYGLREDLQRARRARLQRGRAEIEVQPRQHDAPPLCQINGGLFRASNGNPAGKISEFRAMALAHQRGLGVAIMKFGYADIVAEALSAAQAAYLAAVTDIQAQGVRVAHVTPPLVYHAPAENLPKVQMPVWMLATFAQDVIFDLQDLESTDPVTGSRCEQGGVWEICGAVRSTLACPSLNQGVDAASGQGHLCFDPHARTLAKAFLYAIHRASR